jgi:hypothetical protein
MIVGAVAFFVYACAVCRIIMRYKLTAWVVASAIWLAVAFTPRNGLSRWTFDSILQG